MTNNHEGSATIMTLTNLTDKQLRDELANRKADRRRVEREERAAREAREAIERKAKLDEEYGWHTGGYGDGLGVSYTGYGVSFEVLDWATVMASADLTNETARGLRDYLNSLDLG